MRKSEYPKEPNTLGRLIRKARMDAKLSLMDVVKEIRKHDGLITESYLSRIEADKGVPSQGLVENITRVLKIDYKEAERFLVIENLKRFLNDDNYPNNPDMIVMRRRIERTLKRLQSHT